MTSKERTTMVNHRTLGKVPLRTLSKGELCRTVIALFDRNASLEAQLRQVYSEQQEFIKENEQLKENLKGVHAGFQKFIKDVTENTESK